MLVDIVRGLARLGLAAVLAPVLAFMFAGCTRPEVTACIARCQGVFGEPTMCQTMCTRSCPELRQSFGVSEEVCRKMQASGASSAPAAPATAPEPTPTSAPAATEHRAAGP